MDMVSLIELCLLIVCKLKGEELLYSAILTCMQYLFCYEVMSMMQCMYDVWLCHEFCALCGITLMLCI